MPAQDASGASRAKSKDALASGETVRIKSDDAAASVDEKSSSLSGSVSKTHVTAPAQEASGANRAKSEDALASGETVRIKSDDAASVDEKSSSLSGSVSKTHVTAPAQEASGANRAMLEAALAPGETVRIKFDDAAASADEKSPSLDIAQACVHVFLLPAVSATLASPHVSTTVLMARGVALAYRTLHVPLGYTFSPIPTPQS
jgi:TusA-related sulfurtransferase